MKYSIITRLADEFGVAVVITNQVVAQVDGGAMFQVILIVSVVVGKFLKHFFCFHVLRYFISIYEIVLTAWPLLPLHSLYAYNML